MSSVVKSEKDRPIDNLHDNRKRDVSFHSYVDLKGIYPEFQVMRGFSQKIPAGLLSYDQIHS